MRPLYDAIGSTYAASRRADPSLVSTLARLLEFDRNRSYLDVGCGTGSYTLALNAMGGEWTGVDVSEVMLAQARSAPCAVTWQWADAASLPFADASFDGAICTLAIHHFHELDLPFREMRRVLRSGPLVLFTGFAEQMRNYWLCHYFPEMMRRSIENMPAEIDIREALGGAGFNRIESLPFFVTPTLQDLFLYSGKDRPGLYLDPTIRGNISSFARLSPPDELARGLDALAADLKSGSFDAVRDRYQSRHGDYAFVVAHTGC
jgi:SAM-dependent methyltransferase